MGTLYENINALCKSKGVSGSRMCLDLGLSKSTMSDLKNGRIKGVSIPTAQKIAGYFGISVDELYGEERTEEHIEMYKKNDALSDIIIAMRTDDEFMSIVEAIYKMDKEKRSSLLAFLK